MKLRFLKHVVGLIALSISPFLHAQTWVGGGSGWNDPANWSTNPSLPANNSTITIDGLSAIVDANSDFRPTNINVINGGELIINANLLDVTSEGLTTIDGTNSKLIINTGGLFTAEFINVINDGEIQITGGELDVNDQLTMDNALLSISNGLLDYNGGTGEELLLTDTDVTISGGLLDADRGITVTRGSLSISGGELDITEQLSMTDGAFNLTGGLFDYNGGFSDELLFTNSDVDISGGILEFDRSIIVTGGTFDQTSTSTMTATSDSRNLVFDDAVASLNGTVTNPNGDLSLFGTSVVNLLSDLTMDLDDLVMNDDGESSILNIHGTVVAFDDVKFDEDPPDDVPGDADMIIVRDGGNLTITDSFREANDVESPSGIHVDNNGTLSIGDIPGMTPEEAYGTIVTSDDGANVTMEGSGGLPVELIDFSASETTKTVELKWSTALEINNDYFDLLKSTDGKNFLPIARIQGFGNSNEIRTYSYSDNDITKGIIYYQLKQVDFNGDFEYHPIIDVHINSEFRNSLTVFPNPISSEEVTIFSEIDVSNPRLNIYSLSGRLVFERSLNAAHKWTFTQSELNLPKGLYILKINDEITGSTIDSVKISILD